MIQTKDLVSIPIWRCCSKLSVFDMHDKLIKQVNAQTPINWMFKNGKQAFISIQLLRKTTSIRGGLLLKL